MIKAYKFRLYLSNEQRILVDKTFGCTRLIYNHYLNMKQKEYEETKTIKSTFECIKDLKNLYVEKPFLKEVDSMSLRCAIFDLEDAYKRFYNKTGNYPRFKNKFGKNSYRTNYITSEYKGTKYENIKLDLVSKTITLPKLKEVRIRGYRNLDKIDGRIINATVSKDASDRYYVSVVVEEPDKKINNIPNHIVGIDLGIKSLVVTSDGEKFNPLKPINKYEKRIKKLQRSLSRKVVGSSNYNKIKIRLGIVYRKIRNTRKYYLHGISKYLTDNHNIIVTETLKIKNMIKNHNLAKTITDSSWYELIRQIHYKSRYKGIKFYQIESNYPSSQECSVCGEINKEVKNLNIREWECSECGNYHNRDINAAINIMVRGLRQYVEELV